MENSPIKKDKKGPFGHPRVNNVGIHFRWYWFHPGISSEVYPNVCRIDTLTPELQEKVYNLMDMVNRVRINNETNPN